MLDDTHTDARLRGTDPLLVRASEPRTVDHASVVALGADGALVGRATLSRLYGARGELRLERAPTSAIALALVDALEGDARVRGLAYLELDPNHVARGVTEALRRSRPTRDERRGSNLFLTWPTTNPR